MPNSPDRRRRFEEIALPHARRLFSAASRVVGSSGETEDVVQETFLRAYRTFDNFREGSNARAWLFTILYSILNNRRRQASRRPLESSLTEVEETGPAPLESGAWGSHEKLLRNLDADRMPAEIVQAFARLAPDTRMIILLVDVEELGYEDVSRILGCPVGTVASRLNRARKRLFDSLAATAGSRASRPDPG